MAITPQNRRDAEEIRELVQDTLISISKSMSEAIRVSVEEAVDGVDAKIKDTLGKDLARSMNSLAKASKDSANNLYRVREGLLSSKDISKQLTAIDERRLTLAREVLLAKRNGVPIDQEQLTAINKVLREEKKLLLGEQQKVKDIEKQIGLTGKLISSIAKIPGLGKFVNAPEIEREMRKVAARGGNTFQTMGVAASMVGKQLYQGLLDPLTLITSIWNGFMKVDKAATEFTRTTGQSTNAISSMNSNLATTVDILEVATNISKELGISGSNFITPEQLAAVAETKNLLGLSAEQATRLAIQTKMSGQNVATFKSNVMAGVKQSNLQNKSGVEYGVIIKDILNTSEDVTLSLENNPKKLAAAATAARAFGLTLQQVDSIANSLMNFEDSIGAELEAQLLTGKNINLSKARELALNNDLEGVANELAKNGASAAEFSQMNRIQQEGLAKALGMSREQLAKSILAQEASKSLTDKQRAAVMGMSEAEYERVEVQERIQKSLDKIAQAFAPILEKFVIPIVEGLTSILNLPLVPYLLAGLVAIKSIGGGIFGAVKGMGSLAKGALDFVKNLNMAGVSKFFNKIRDSFRQGATGTGASSPIPPGRQPGTDPSSMTGGFSKINTTALIKGAAAMAIAAVGIFIFAKAIQELEKIEDWGQVAIGLGAFAVSMGVLAAVGNIAGPGLTALGTGLTAFGVAMIGPGGLGLLALTGAVIGLGFALNLAAPGIQAFGTVVTAAFAGLATLITVVADGFVKILGAVTMENIGPMLLLGPALFGIAAGLGAVSLAGLMALPAIGGLIALSLAAPALVSLGIGGESKSAGEAKGKEEGIGELVKEVKALVTELAKGKPVQIMLDSRVAATAILGGGGGAAKTASAQG